MNFHFCITKPQVRTRMKWTRHILLWGCLSISVISFAQSGNTDTLTLNQFFQIIQRNHPVAKQIRQMVSAADAAKLRARGNFDPKLFTQYESKNFQGKEYFNMLDAGLQIPTWAGLDIKAGLENNRGYQINPESSTPDGGLTYAKITVPLLQGLIIDERRAILKQASIAQNMSVFEMANAMNELYYLAGKSYFDWQLSLANLQVYEKAYALSIERMAATRRNAALGDRPGIDTVEARIQMQDRYVQLIQSQNDVFTARLQLSVFLWNDSNQPLELKSDVMPDPDLQNRMTDRLDSIMQTNKDLFSTHPYLKTLDLKISQLEIDKKWKKEKLKPILNLSYSPLTDANRFSALSFNQNKWGVGFAFPLLLRKERGDLQLAQLKIQTAQWERDQKRNEMQIKLSVAANKFTNLRSQEELQKQNVGNYEKLWLSEKKMFDLGESSLFMINAREMSYMTSQIKLNDLRNKYIKAGLEVEYAKGQLGK